MAALTPHARALFCSACSDQLACTGEHSRRAQSYRSMVIGSVCRPCSGRGPARHRHRRQDSGRHQGADAQGGRAAQGTGDLRPGAWPRASPSSRSSARSPRPCPT
ncbi:MAG: hypothetical protein MZV70_01845 [Desulfobacterales bacterium]|nr:hypothetical protein [Desulfobacterales bacterium]